MPEVTQLLQAIEHGNPHAAEMLLPLVYDELRKLASAKLVQEKPGQTYSQTSIALRGVKIIAAPPPAR